MHAGDSSSTRPRTRIGTPDLRPGALLAGRYRLGECVGTGGFAAVFRADDERLHRQVAVKVLDVLEWAREDQVDECLARFSSEARAAARIEHPAVVTIYDMGVLEPEGVPYIVMELLRGHDLEQELDQFGALAPDRAIRCIRQGLQALVAAHGMGIVHRDLKPSNLFLVNPRRPTESLRVLDFGIARFLDASANLTKTGQMMGTARFMAPEYINDGVVTPQSDVYQMGLILAELLTGRRVIDAEQFALAVARASAGRLDLPDNLMDSAIGPVLRRAVAVDPQNRFRSAGHFLSMLDRIDPHSLQDLASDAPSVSRRPVTCMDAPPELDSQPRTWIGEELAPYDAKDSGAMVIVTQNPGGGLDPTAASPAEHRPLDSLEFALPVATPAAPDPSPPAAATTRAPVASAAGVPELSGADDPVTPMWKAFSAPVSSQPSAQAKARPVSGEAVATAAPGDPSATPREPAAVAAHDDARARAEAPPRFPGSVRPSYPVEMESESAPAPEAADLPAAQPEGRPTLVTRAAKAPQTAEMRVDPPVPTVQMRSTRPVSRVLLAAGAVGVVGVLTVASLGAAIGLGGLGASTDAPDNATSETAALAGSSGAAEVATPAGNPEADTASLPTVPAGQDGATPDAVPPGDTAAVSSDTIVVAPTPEAAPPAGPRVDPKPRRSRAKRSAKPARASRAAVAAPAKTKRPDFVKRRLPD